MRRSCLIITNNPVVFEKISDRYPVIYKDVSYGDILKEVRDRVHMGCRLLSHPLSGSVKPNETPYKSIMVEERGGEVDCRSLQLIENAVQVYGKFPVQCSRYKPCVLEDFQLIDYTLLESALASAESL